MSIIDGRKQAIGVPKLAAGNHVVSTMQNRNANGGDGK